MSFGKFLIAPLSSMLGIRAGMNVSVHNAPAGFMEALFPLPEGTHLLDTAKTGLDVQVLFTEKKTELIEKLTALTRGMSVMGAVWICFPASTEQPHAPSEDFVRLAALELGLTDTKKLMLDPAWNALKLQWKPRNPRVDLPSARA
ncbi:MAG TPA: DUF3052 domain-containing protein [Archangium sp.]